jgi:hypothetical protein
MGRPDVNVKYGEYSIDITLPTSIGLQAFRADQTNYVQKLQGRTGLPTELRRLLGQLFERRAIVSCSITFGHRVILRIPPVGLMQYQALNAFGRHFREITGQKITATWEASGSRGRDPRRSSFDSNALLRAVGIVVDVAAEGLQIAAAIKILSDD